MQLHALHVCSSTLPALPSASSAVGAAMPDACMSLLPQWLQGGLLTCITWDFLFSAMRLVNVHAV